MKKRSFVVVLMILSVLVSPLFAGGSAQAKSEKKTISYWTMWNEAEPQGRVLAEAAEAFEDETGIVVDITFNGREIRKTLQPALESGKKLTSLMKTLPVLIQTGENTSFL